MHMRKSKAGKGAGPVMFLVMLIIGIVVSAGIIYGGYTWLHGGSLSVAKDGEKTLTSATECSSETSPDYDPDAFDAYNPGTAVTEPGIYRKVGDSGWTSFTEGTNIANLIFGQKYEFAFGVNGTDSTDFSYGPHFTTDAIPCMADVPVNDLPVFNDEVETSLTATFFNENHDASAQTFLAGANHKIYLKEVAGTDEVFGNPYIPDETPNVVCLNLNTSEWDKPLSVSVHEGYAYSIDSGNQLAKKSLAGTTLKAVSTPQRHSAVASMIVYCYESPVIGPDGLEVKIDMDADNTNAPGTDMTAHFYAANFYLDSDTGDIEYGVENEEGAAVGTDASDTLSMDFTA